MTAPRARERALAVALTILRRHFGPVEVLAVHTHTPAAASRRQQLTPRRLFRP